MKKITCKCNLCGKKPNEISEYVDAASAENMTPTDYVMREEGTYNPQTGAFYCTSCYIKIGMPLGVA